MENLRRTYPYDGSYRWVSLRCWITWVDAVGGSYCSIPLTDPFDGSL